MENLYRYMPFESFVDTIQNKALTLVRPHLWDDVYEYYAIEKQLEKIGREESKQNMMNTVKYCTYAQSWTCLAESDAMWRIYGKNNNTIKIAVRKKNIENLGVKVKKVHYTNNIDECIKGEEKFKASDLLSIKREAFSHEKEYRIFGIHNLEKMHKELSYSDMIEEMKNESYPDANSTEFNEFIEKHKDVIDKIQSFKEQNVLKVPFEEIDNFIEEVVVHPMAEQWFYEMVKKFCINNGLDENKIIKSNLYTK